MTAVGARYLLGGLAVLTLWLAWLRHGKAVCRRCVEVLVARSHRTPTGLRWADPWSAHRLGSPLNRSRAVFWMWLPTTAAAPVFAAAFLASAIDKFTR